MSETKVPPQVKKWTSKRPTLLFMSDEKRRPRPAAQYGPTAEAVAANVARLRKARGWTIYELSGLLRTKADRAVTPSAVAKVEKMQRQVSVDELAALAVVFGVSPGALLLPLTLEGTVEVTGAGEVPASTAWEWMDNARPLTLPPDDKGTAMLEYQLYSLPPGRRRGGLHAQGERSPEVLRAKREFFEKLASWGALDLEAEKQRDPEPWEVED